MPEDNERENSNRESDKEPSELGFPGVYGRFGDHPDEAKLPQLSIIPGMIATILWVALLLWLANLPGGPLYLSPKASPPPPTPVEGRG